MSYHYGKMTENYSYNWSENNKSGYAPNNQQPSYKPPLAGSHHPDPCYYRTAENKVDERWMDHKPKYSNIIHGKSEIVEPMVQLSHHGHQMSAHSQLYQHERTPVLVPNPHYLKFQQKHHTVTPPSSSPFYPSSVDFSQRSDSSSQSGSPNHQHLSQDLSSSHSSVTNSPNSLSKPKPSRGNRSYQCPQCVKVFRRGDHLKRHLLSVHDHEHPYQCGDCGKGFANVASLAKHARSLHADITSKGHLCLRCKLTFQTNIELETHATSLHVKEDQEYMQNINSSSKQHACTFCSKTFTSIANVKKHVQLLHKNKINQKTECDKCGKVFTRPDSLRKHKQREHSTNNSPSNISPIQNETTAPSTMLNKEFSPALPAPKLEIEQNIEMKPSFPANPNQTQNENKFLADKNDFEKQVKSNAEEEEVKLPPEETKPTLEIHKNAEESVSNAHANEIKQESPTPLLVSESFSNAMKTLQYFAHDPIPGLDDNDLKTMQTLDESHDANQSNNDIGSFLLHTPPPSVQLANRNSSYLVVR